MTRAFCCAAKAIARITSAMTSEVPTTSTGAPGTMPTMPRPFARPPTIEATAVPWMSTTAGLPATAIPARSGWVGSAGVSTTATSGTAAGGGACRPATRKLRQSVAPNSSPPAGAWARATGRLGSENR